MDISKYRMENGDEYPYDDNDNILHELATRYHMECEAYDRTVCTGPTTRDGVMPANQREMALINRNAHAVRKILEEAAQREGIGREDLSRAIRKWHGSFPNAKQTPKVSHNTQKIRQTGFHE